jgi:hypothetical protein
VDHKGEETVLLADAVWTWDDASALGPESFARAVAAGDRPRRGGRDRGSWGADRSGSSSGGGTGAWRDRNGTANGSGGGHPNGTGSPNGAPYGNGSAAPARPVVAVPVGPAPAPPSPPPRVVPVRPPLVRTVAHVSPLRGGGVLGTLEVTIDGPSHTTRRLTSAGVAAMPPAPVEEPPAPSSIVGLAPDGPDEPPWPDEARAAVSREAAAPTLAVEAAPGQVLHVRFRPIPADQVLAGFQALKELIHERPGDTGVVLHIPAGPGREQEMTLRVGVAYDADLVTEATRRIGAMAELQLA